MITKCAAELVKASDGLINQEEADRLVKELATRVRRGRNTALDKDLATLVAKKAKELAEELSVEAAIEKRNRTINLARYKAAYEKVATSKNKFEAIKGILVTTPTKGNSAAAKQDYLHIKFFRDFLVDLEQENLDVAFNSGNHDDAIAVELFEMTQPESIRKQGRSGNQEAMKIAQVIRKHQDQVIERQNNAGAWIRKLPGYIAKTTHDQEAIRKAGFDKWFKFITEDANLDIDLTLRNVEAGKEKQFFQSVWEALATGQHFKHGESNFDINQAFKSSGSLAKKLSRERLLHFKTPEGWMKYNREFGLRNLRESIYAQMNNAAESIGLMETLGTNPHATLTKLKEDAAKLLRPDVAKGNKTAMRQLEAINGKNFLGRNELDILMAHIDGTTRHVAGSLTLAKIGSFTRFAQTLSKLGGATISAFSDIPLIMSEMRFQGINFLDSHNRNLIRFTAGRGSKENKEIANLLLAGTEGFLGQMRSRFSPDGPGGFMAKAQHLFFKANLMTPWNDFWKNASTMVMSANLANQANRSWRTITPELKRVLSFFDIDETDWSVVKKTLVSTGEGSKVAVPEKINDLTTEELSALLGKELSDSQAKTYKKNFQDKFNAYFIERANTAIPTPGANEAGNQLQGFGRGDILGEVLRWIGQFKSFPMTILSKVYGRETVGRIPGGASEVGMRSIMEGMKEGKGAMSGIVQTMIGTTMMGYLSMQAKEMLKGRTPRTATDAKSAAKLMAASFVQGGGAGIYGDFLFGEFNRYGNTPLATVAGPVLSQFEDVVFMWQQIKDGDVDAANSLFRLFKNNTPFINLFYTRTALDYMLFYQLEEMMNPGYLRRMERRIQRENDQEFIFAPSQHSSILGVKP